MEVNLKNTYFNLVKKHNRWEGKLKSPERLKIVVCSGVQDWDGTYHNIDLYRFYKGRYEWVYGVTSNPHGIGDHIDYMTTKAVNRRWIKEIVKHPVSNKDGYYDVVLGSLGNLEKDDGFATANGRYYTKEALRKAVENYKGDDNIRIDEDGNVVGTIKISEEFSHVFDQDINCSLKSS